MCDDIGQNTGRSTPLSNLTTLCTSKPCNNLVFPTISSSTCIREHTLRKSHLKTFPNFSCYNDTKRLSWFLFFFGVCTTFRPQRLQSAEKTLSIPAETHLQIHAHRNLFWKINSKNWFHGGGWILPIIITKQQNTVQLNKMVCVTAVWVGKKNRKQPDLGSVFLNTFYIFCWSTMCVQDTLDIPV